MNPDELFAHYKIIGPIGRGAMGEVYSAIDTRLDRKVAIKVLPDSFVEDPERLARFRREAKVLAALNHTNVAAIHGLEEDKGKIFLAMELAAGETLETVINNGPLPVEEVIAIMVQIASGLEEAHEKGIVHRDLKPANVIVSQDGLVKVLDFGLARAYEGDESSSSEDSGTSPTLTAAMTQAGVILGTAAYMSPEQARGYAVDNRTDIWAFGVIIWELLAGRRLFAGDTVSDTLAMVLRSEPDWDSLPADLSPSLRRLIQRCLQREKRQRMHHIADARIVLEDVLQDGTSAYEAATGSIAPSSAMAARSNRLGWAAAVVMTLLAGFLGWQVTKPPVAPESPVVSFDIQLPQGQWVMGENQPLAISPDGQEIVVRLKSPTGSQLHLRTLDSTTVVPVPFTENGHTPYYSRDGKWLTFVRSGTLHKIPMGGGTAITLTDQAWGGGSWTSDERIVFTRNYDTGL